MGDGLERLVGLVNGCRRDGDGIIAKKHMVHTHCESNAGTAEGDKLQVLCQLHERGCIEINPTALLAVIKWKSATAVSGKAQDEASAHPGFFLTSVLAGCDAAEMPSVAGSFIAANSKIDQVDLLRYVANKGFAECESGALESTVDWAPTAGKVVDKSAAWRAVWGSDNPFPEGKPWFGTIRDSRGARCKVAFLGSCTEDAKELGTPSLVLRKTWKVPNPSLLVVADAGSMHPTQCDSISRMCHLPQFCKPSPGRCRSLVASTSKRLHTLRVRLTCP